MGSNSVTACVGPWSPLETSLKRPGPPLLGPLDINSQLCGNIGHLKRCIPCLCKQTTLCLPDSCWTQQNSISKSTAHRASCDCRNTKCCLRCVVDNASHLPSPENPRLHPVPHLVLVLDQSVPAAHTCQARAAHHENIRFTSLVDSLMTQQAAMYFEQHACKHMLQGVLQHASQ